jgi:hypothetical protein
MRSIWLKPGGVSLGARAGGTSGRGCLVGGVAAVLACLAARESI